MQQPERSPSALSSTVHLPPLCLLAFAAVFVVLATANAAGYRYGASDQAFYVPAVLRHLDPALFPGDAPLIDSQAHLTLVDETIATVMRITRAPLPATFLAFYLVTLLVLFAAVIRLGRLLYSSEWSVMALAAALTLRHAIAKTGANTLESYFHPRQLAFALGVWAVAMFVARRGPASLALVVVAAVIHPTTALWFGVWLAVAFVWQYAEWRRAAVGAVVVLAPIALWLLWRGPFAGRLRVMDAAWLAVIGDKDYLFPLGWPLDVWLTNLVSIPIIVVCWRVRRAAGIARERESAVVAGVLALFLIFLAWLPFNVERIALAVQLQTSRVFWMLDFFAVVCLIGTVAESRRRGRQDSQRSRRPLIVALVILALSSLRGGYAMLVQFPDRSLFTTNIPRGDWANAMAWARATDVRSGWLADPLHAARYGSSVRVAGQRDVFLERIKDTAIAMYDRDIAMRIGDRERAIAGAAWDTPEGARELARRYDLDYLVIDRAMPLPLAYRAGSLSIYRLR